jgi:arsenate reductase
MYNFPEVTAYSGGTVATACHPNTISALKQIGFEVKCDNPEAENPLYRVYYSEDDYVECYSKANTDDALPQADFIAIMTCSDSDDNCPLVPGAKVRYSTTFDDPSEFDDSEDAVEHYVERSLQIAGEAIYVFRRMFLMA